MKPVPTDPYALQSRIMAALIDDLVDPKADSFPRLDALRASMKAGKLVGGGGR